MSLKFLIASVTLAMGTMAMAQAVPQAAASTPRLDKREVMQQKRIDQGVASGQLTAKETNNLDKREAKLAANETAAKADGKVTRAERGKLERQANRDSKAIHRQKHDKQTAAPAAQ